HPRALHSFPTRRSSDLDAVRHPKIVNQHTPEIVVERGRDLLDFERLAVRLDGLLILPRQEEAAALLEVFQAVADGNGVCDRLPGDRKSTRLNSSHGSIS